MRSYILSLAAFVFLVSAPVYASEIEGTINTGITTGALGDVIVTPSALPLPSTYTSVQSVTIAASGADSIRYTVDTAAPTCSTGSVYIGAITVASSHTIRAVACYKGNASAVGTFVYTITIPASSSSPSSNSSSNSSSGSSSSSGGSPSSGGNKTTTTAPVAATSTKGKVLGESTILFTRDLVVGAKGDDVKALQAILRAEGFFTFTTDTGNYGVLTAAAVKKYQARYGIPTTGNVESATRRKLNDEGGAPRAQTAPVLTGEQKAALIASLEAQLKVLIAQLAELMKKK